MTSEDQAEDILQEILDAAKEAINDSIPLKSRETYVKTYTELLDWMKRKKTTSFDEIVLLAYFKEISTKSAPSTLWPKYSMLKTMVNVEKKINISNYYKLQSFIKRINVGFKPKKAKTFSSEEIKKYLMHAPDEQYLDVKVALILGITGACRREELYNLTVNDLTDNETHFIIHIPKTKTNIERKFTVNEPFTVPIRNYMALRPSDTRVNNFFLNFRKGKCTKQVIGINKLGGMPKMVAEFLKLPDSKEYTGHSFRRTSATLLANAGASITKLKRHGGWKSSQVAEGYVEDSINNKRKICDKITESLIDETSCDTNASNVMKKMKLINDEEKKIN